MPSNLPSIHAIADYVIISRTKQNKTTTPQLLQKLVYYVQAWALAINGRSVFKEKFEAWELGPVNAQLHARFEGGHTGYRLLGESDVSPSFIVSELPLNLRKHIDEVLDAYKDYSLYQLNILATTELPWTMAVKRIKTAETKPEISEEQMKLFYKKLWKENSK